MEIPMYVFNVEYMLDVVIAPLRGELFGILHSLLFLIAYLEDTSFTTSFDFPDSPAASPS